MTTLRRVPEPSEALRLRVAAEVRAWKGRRNVTQIQLARVLGISQPSISAKLSGKTPFDLDELDLLATFFDISPARLVGESDGGPPSDGGSPSPAAGDTRKSLLGNSPTVTTFTRKARKSDALVGNTPSHVRYGKAA